MLHEALHGAGVEAEIVSEKKLKLLLQEAKELMAILTSAGKKKKENMWKTKVESRI